MAVSDRPDGPHSQAATVANQIPLNTQATQTQVLSGPLPVLFTLAGTAETQVPSAANAAVPLSIAIPPDTDLEQTVFDEWWSGYIKTTASGTITIKVYAGSSATIGSNTLLGSSGAITQNSATSPYFAHLVLIYDSVSGTMTGKIDFYVNKIIVAAVTLSNFITGIKNSGNPSANPPTVANLPTFTATFASSGATSGTLTTINVQKASVG